MIRGKSKQILVALVCLLSINGMRPGVAQDVELSNLSVIEAGRIPSDAITFVSLSPKSIFAMPGMELYPHEVISAAGLEYVGFDPLKIERVDVAVGLNPLTGPTVGALITTTEPIDVTRLKNVPIAKEIQADKGGFQFYASSDPELAQMNIVVAPIDAKHVLVGHKPYVQRMAKAVDTEGRIAQAVASLRSGQEFLAILDFAVIRPMVQGQLEGSVRNIPPPLIDPLATLVESTDMIALRWGASTGLLAQAVLSGLDEASATQVEKSLTRLKTTGVEMLRDNIHSEMEIGSFDATTPESIRKAISIYIDRVIGMGDQSLAVNRNGKRVTVAFEQANIGSLASIQSVGVMAGLLLPAIQQAREAARRMSCSNNMRQLQIGMLNYESTYRKFPAAAIFDKAAQKPLLSWRVAILPFIEEQELYEQFHLDEAWDSPHNMKLLERMPAIFKCPSSVLPAGYTNYLAVVGDDFAISPTQSQLLSSFTDGTSNTIMLVEAGRDSAVPWSAPEDLKPIRQSPSQGLFPTFHFGGGHMIFTDGAVRFITQEIDEETLWSYFTRAGGEVNRSPFE